MANDINGNIEVSSVDIDANISTSSVNVDGYIMAKGASGTITINNVSTGDPGTDAIVENVGSPSSAILNITIPRGDKGNTGNTGANGQDGFSPTATVTKSGSVSTFTVTDKNGTTSVEILDGSGGGGGAVDSVNGKTGTVVLTTSDLTNDSNYVADASYVHTDNNYTTTEKNKLSSIESGAEENIIETVKVNGSALTPSSKAVDISVPTKISDLTNDSDFVEDSSYVHTDNNYTSTEKTKLSGIETGAEVNAIETISVNGTPQTIDTNKNVNITISGSGSVTGVKGDAESTYRDGDVNITKANIGLGNVENKSSATIRGELTSSDVTTALGYTPPQQDTTYNEATTSVAGLMSATDKTKLDGIDSGAEVNVIETVKVNGTALTPTSKAVNVTVPTKTSDLTNDDNVVKDASYVHTDNNYTSTEKSKLDGIEAGADVNVIESISVNGTPQTITNKNVDITVSGGGSVTGVKGDSETTYRTGNVNITPANIGLGNVDNTADANKSVASAGTLTTARKIDGVTFDGSGDITHYGTCSTTYSTTEKAVTTDSTFSYVTGARLTVKFTSTSDTGTNGIKLNVNSLGAKTVRDSNYDLYTSYIKQGQVIDFIYDGTIFVAVDSYNTSRLVTTINDNMGSITAKKIAVDPSSTTDMNIWIET